MTETFAPTVNVHGKTVTPVGWMWVWGFAVGGCEWAIREAGTEDFKNRVKLWYAEREAYYLENSMTEHLQQLQASMAEYEKTTKEIDDLRKELRL